MSDEKIYTQEDVIKFPIENCSSSKTQQGFQICPKCNGEGQIPPHFDLQKIYTQCPVCLGRMIINKATGLPPVVRVENSDEFQSVTNDWANGIAAKKIENRAKIYEGIIIDILRKCLNREPVLEDAKMLTIVKHPVELGEPTASSIYFENVLVGTIIEYPDSVAFRLVTN